MPIKSMTGYGGAKGVVEGLNVSIELKSVNNKFLDVSVRMPRGYLFAEDALRSAVGKHISRGKVDVFLSVDASQAEDTVVRVNEPLARAYVEAVRAIAAANDLPAELTALSVAKFPDVLSVEKTEADKDVVTAGFEALMEQALEEYDAMRLREGDKLRQDVETRLGSIEALVREVEKKAPETVEAYHQRLRQKLEAVLEGRDVDEARVITECAVFADHIAVDEETVRLHSHLSQMRQMLQKGSPFGRKADFLIQEFNREANTIGSKCQNAEIAKVVVDLKSEIEKIREQIQNIE